MTSSLSLTGLLVSISIVILVGVPILVSIVRSARGDLGDGLGKVVLPVPRAVRALRLTGFTVANVFGGMLVVVDLDRIKPLFWSAEQVITGMLISGPSATTPYLKDVFVLYPALILVGLVTLALFEQSPLRRRLVSVLPVLAFVAITIWSVGIFTALSAEFAVAPGVFQWVVTTFMLATGFFVMLSILQHNLQLPRAMQIPFSSLSKGSALVALGLAILVATVISVTVFVLVSDWLSLTLAEASIGVLFSLPAISLGTYLLLYVSAPAPKRGHATGRIPSLTVIMPAYNEEVVIERTLAAIDEAAAHYRGTVYVVVADDGSTDSTPSIIEATFASYQWANGSLVRCPHRGKAGALNAALEASTTEIVVRIDADTLVDDKVFVPLPDWFANPEIGMVGALDLPHPDLEAWYSYGRLFECLRAFAFGRLAQMRVNGIVCVPGTYSAFRRSVAMSINGFVEGMNGEDADLTIQVARLGYRVVVDTDIVIYEDVPQTWLEFKKQRVRWFRGGTQIFSRHFLLRRENLSTVMVFGYDFSLAKFRAVVHPLMVFGLGSVIFLFPGGYDLLAKLFFLLVLGNIPTYVTLAVLAWRHGYGRKIPWLIILFPFGIAKRLAAIESLMSIPTQGSQLVPDGPPSIARTVTLESSSSISLH